MDVGRVIYTTIEAYVAILVIVSLVTVAWLFDFFGHPSAQLAGIWFAVSGFGVLVIITILLIHLTRD